MEDEETQVDDSTVESDEGKTSAPSQEKRTEKEKAAYSLKKTAERLKELGGDPAEVLGTKTHIDVDEEQPNEKPLTVGMYRDMIKQDAHKTALQYAEDLQDADTKATVKSYLSDRLKPSGDPEADFRLALAAASAEKNKQVIAELNRAVPPKRTASGGSMPAFIEDEFTPTSEEAVMMRPPYNVSKDKIIAARKKTAER